jgi:hypothetical protein
LDCLWAPAGTAACSRGTPVPGRKWCGCWPTFCVPKQNSQHALCTSTTTNCFQRKWDEPVSFNHLCSYFNDNYETWLFSLKTSMI